MHECGVRGFLESEHLGFSLLQLIPNLLRDLGQVNESLVSGRSWFPRSIWVARGSGVEDVCE